uniref:Trafficking kinesin-binding protein 1 n=1 Tax=Cacopsylla melanoneura TaxID=428564 RepID=A0A8D9DRA6_9HEMI
MGPCKLMHYCVFDMILFWDLFQQEWTILIKLAGLTDGARSPPKTLAPTPPVTKCNVETLTDVCCGGDLPEVEIISLLEEQLPQYKLRADTLTEFIGYDNQDWFIPSGLQADDPTALTPDQIRETLNYFRK